MLRDASISFRNNWIKSSILASTKHTTTTTAVALQRHYQDHTPAPSSHVRHLSSSYLEAKQPSFNSSAVFDKDVTLIDRTFQSRRESTNSGREIKDNNFAQNGDLSGRYGTYPLQLNSANFLPQTSISSSLVSSVNSTINTIRNHNV